MIRKKMLSLQDVLIELYAKTKEKVFPEASVTDFEELRKLDSLIIVEYIGRLIETLLERQSNPTSLTISDTKNSGCCLLDINESNMLYEKQLQENEFSIRNHIKIENQLKLQNEAYISKIDELHKTLASLSKESNLKSDSTAITNFPGKVLCTLRKRVDYLNKKIEEQATKIEQMKSQHDLEMKLVKQDLKMKCNINFKTDSFENSSEIQKTTGVLTRFSKTLSSTSLIENPVFNEEITSRTNKLSSNTFQASPNKLIKRRELEIHLVTGRALSIIDQSNQVKYINIF